MSLVKKFGDYTVNLVPQYVDGEYEESIEHKSNTVLVNSLPFTIYLVGAILAWAIPGPRSLLSLLVLIPLMVGSMVGNGWMKHYAPRPKPVIPAPLIIGMLIPVVIMFAGISYNIADGMNAFSWSAVFGAVIGGPLGLWAAMWSMKTQRKQDIDRFEAELED